MKTEILNYSLAGTKVIITKEETIVVMRKVPYLTDVPASTIDWSFSHKEIRTYNQEFLKTITTVVGERPATEEEINIGMTLEDVEEMFSVLPV